MNLDDVLMFWGFWMGIGWLAWVAGTTFRRVRTARLQADVQTRLLERFGSSREMLDYLQTGHGQRFLAFVATERANPYPILAAAQAGVIMTLLGGAFLLLMNMARVHEAADVLLVLGTLVLTLGIGFLASAALSFVLSRSWGLFNERSEIPSGS